MNPRAVVSRSDAPALLLCRRRSSATGLRPVMQQQTNLRNALAQRLVAVIPAELFVGKAEILEKTLAIERQIELEVEERLLGELIESAGARGRGTCGLAPTLEALWAGQVQTLVVADGAHAAGSECPNCARLEPGTVTTCPACGKAMQPVHDLFHRAMGRVLEQAGSAEVMHGDAARRLLELGGGLGALLRYPMPTVHASTDR